MSSNGTPSWSATIWLHAVSWPWPRRCAPGSGTGSRSGKAGTAPAAWSASPAPVQGGVGGLLVGVGLRPPEAPPRPAHVPVAQVVQELLHRPRGAVDVIVVQRRGDRRRSAPGAARGSTVEVAKGRRDGHVLVPCSAVPLVSRSSGCPLVQVRVRHKEAVHVPQRQEEALDGFLGQLRRQTACRLRSAGRRYIQRITSAPMLSAASLNSMELPQRLVHRAAVLGQQGGKAQHGLGGGLVLQRGAPWSAASRTSCGTGPGRTR